MDALTEKLDARLREWKPETAAAARECITEVTELADHEVLISSARAPRTRRPSTYALAFALDLEWVSR